ncbi:MAG: CvpA family protein [Gallionellaceae bacterium]|jgi:membrane protein required for colicin V production|nr:CvpA family protein [Gallionellaceae bacterium]
MTSFDFAVIVIVALSALLGWWRGLVYESLSLAGWVVAYLVAREFSPMVEPWLPVTLGDESLRMGAAYVVLFIVMLIAASILAWALSKAVRSIGLGWPDATLGFAFGAARGGLIVLALVVLAGLTDIPQQPFWRDAKMSAPLVQAALAIKEKLPPDFARQMNY